MNGASYLNNNNNCLLFEVYCYFISGFDLIEIDYLSCFTSIVNFTDDYCVLIKVQLCINSKKYAVICGVHISTGKHLFAYIYFRIPSRLLSRTNCVYWLYVNTRL